jgi:mevalonate kinase
MLFGEYAVIRGSKALAVPFQQKGGRLFLADEWTEESKQSNKYIRTLHSYLSRNESFDFIDSDGMYQDLDHLAFETDIPIGYGLGSSGALVAAIYEQYKNSEAQSNEELMERLAGMESCFHGQSSGLDPLVSYLQMGVVTEKGTAIQVVDPPESHHFWLLDTGISRSTATLVSYFTERLEEDAFCRVVDRLAHLNSVCIDKLVDGEAEEISQEVKEISFIQLEHFKNMIPKGLEKVWNDGIQGGDYFIKLCGAGGGGFMLVYAKDPQALLQIKFPLSPINPS